MVKYEVQLTKEKYWYVRIVSKNNGQTLLVSETYRTKFNAKRAADKLIRSLTHGALESGDGKADIDYKEVI